MPKNVYGQELIANPNVPGAWILAPTSTPQASAPTPTVASTTTVTGDKVTYDPATGRILTSSNPNTPIAPAPTNNIPNAPWNVPSGKSDIITGDFSKIVDAIEQTPEQKATLDAANNAPWNKPTTTTTTNTTQNIKQKTTGVNTYSTPTFVKGLTDTQKNQILNLANTKPVSSWTSQDIANWNTATNKAPLPISNTETSTNLSDYVDKGTTKTDGNTNIKTDTLSDTTPEEGTAGFTGNKNVTSNIDMYEQQMMDIVNTKVADISTKIEAQYKQINDLMSKMNTEMTSMNVPQLYKSAMDAFDLTGKLATSNDFANQLQSMLTTVYEDVPGQGMVSRKVLSANALGKAAGLQAAYNVAKDNVQTGASIIGSYYQSLGNSLSQRMTTYQNMLSSASSNFLNLTNTEKDYVSSKLTMLQNQANEYKSAEEMITEFTQDAAFIYSEPFDLENDTIDVISKKIAKAKEKYAYASEAVKEYPDAKINASMSLSQIQDAISKSSSFLSKKAGTSSTPTSYQEWTLAGGQTGTGMTYNEWLNKKNNSTSTKDAVTTAMDINTKFTKDTEEISKILSNTATIESLIADLRKNGKTEFTESESGQTQAIITLFNKILDPSSVVREGEYARTEASQGVLNTIKGFVESLTSGRKVTLDTLESVYDSAKTIVDGSTGALADKANMAINWATQMGLSEEDVIPYQISMFLKDYNTKNFPSWMASLNDNDYNEMANIVKQANDYSLKNNNRSLNESELMQLKREYSLNKMQL